MGGESRSLNEYPYGIIKDAANASLSCYAGAPVDSIPGER